MGLPVTNYISIQKKIDKYRGKAALHVGEPYNVYRTGNNAAQNWIDALNQVAQNVAILRRVDGGSAIEAPKNMGTLFFEVMGNMDPYFVGDVFVQNDPVYGTGDDAVDFGTSFLNAFCLAYHAPMKKSYAGRLDRSCKVYRMPTAPDSSGYLSQSLDMALPLILSNGIFVFGTVGQTPAQIPMGFQGSPKLQQAKLYDGAPSDIGSQVWHVYAPPMLDSGGVSLRIRENDRIVVDDGARFVVRHPYRQETGFVGGMFLVEREVTQ